MPVKDPTFRGATYQRVRDLVEQAGDRGIAIEDAAAHEGFVYHSKPRDAVRRAFRQLVEDGVAVSMSGRQHILRVRMRRA